MQVAGMKDYEDLRNGSFQAETPREAVPSPGDPFSGNDSKVNLLNASTPAPGYRDDKSPGYFGAHEVDIKSEAGGSAFASGDMFRNMDTRGHLVEKGNEKKMEEVDVVKVSGSRKRWLFVVWLLTWYLPNFAIQHIGRMKRKDIRTAWREKFAINLLIWAACAFVIFFIGKQGLPRRFGSILIIV